MADYLISLSFSGASGEYSDDMTLRDDLWKEIKEATGLKVELDHEGEVYDTAGVTQDPQAQAEFKALAQKIKAKSTGEFYLDGAFKATVTVESDHADIELAFKFD